MFVETAALAALTPDALRILKAVLSLIKRYGDRNTVNAAEEFRGAMDDVSVDTARGLEELERVVGALVEMVVRKEDWKDRPEHDKPTAGDVFTRAEDFARDAFKAGGHGKRKILWNAFHSSFKPEFYCEGWSKHLWRIAEQVEYPECRFLADMLRRHDPRHGTKPRAVVRQGEDDYFLARRLESVGLVYFSRNTDPEGVTATDLGQRLIEFVWDEEMWRDDALETK